VDPIELKQFVEAFEARNTGTPVRDYLLRHADWKDRLIDPLEDSGPEPPKRKAVSGRPRVWSDEDRELLRKLKREPMSNGKSASWADVANRFKIRTGKEISRRNAQFVAEEK